MQHPGPICLTSFVMNNEFDDFRISDGIIEWRRYNNEVDIFSQFTDVEWQKIASDITSKDDWEDLLSRYSDFVKCFLLWKLSDNSPIGFVYLMGEPDDDIVSIHGGGWKKSLGASLLYRRALKLLSIALLGKLLRVRTSCSTDNRRAERFLRGVGFVPYRRANGVINFWISKKRMNL